MNEHYENFGIMSYSFHGLMNIGAIDIFGVLESVKYRYGVKNVDIWNGFFPNYDEKFVTALKQGIEERGLTVANLCCDNAHIWDDDKEAMKKNEEIAWKCLDVAEKIGAKTIRMDVGIMEMNMPDEQLEYVSKKFKDYCKKAATFGAKLGTENHWGASRSVKNINKLFEAVDEENFGLLLHLGNWDDGNDKNMNDLEVINKAMHIHIDYEHCMIADEILPQLMKKGYSGVWTVESHKSTNEYNNVAYQLANVKRVLGAMNYSGAWENLPPSVKI